MICIDPGSAGGLVSLGKAFRVISMPKTKRDVSDFIKSCQHNEPYGKVAYLEELVRYAGTNMPSSSMAVYASNHGFIEGVLTALDFRIVMVPPKKWQKALGLGAATGLTKTVWKNKLKTRAQQLYPQVTVTLATADALLICEAARRNLLG